VAILIGAWALPARAQGQTYPQQAAFINVSVGAQPQRRTLNATDSFSLYDETATTTSVQRIRNGALIDVSAGYRVMRHLAIAAGFSSFGRPGTAILTASVPDPVFYGRPKTIAADAADLKHTERAVHLQAMWFMPVTRRIDVAFSGGPSFIRVNQQVATAHVASGTQNVTPATIARAGTARGFNAGFQGNYLFRSQYAVGLFVGYAGGTIDLHGAENLKVGGLRTGLAVQARF
jgi:hypothetical protein